MARITNKYWKNLDPWEMCGQDKYCKRDCHGEGGCTNGCIVPTIYIELAKREDAEEESANKQYFTKHEVNDDSLSPCIKCTSNVSSCTGCQKYFEWKEKMEEKNEAHNI